MPRVVEHAATLAAPDLRQHAWQHRPQTCPRNHARCRDTRKIAARPVDERCDPVRANIAIKAVDFSRTRYAKTVGAKPACHDLRAVVEQADPRCPLATRSVIQAHG